MALEFDPRIVNISIEIDGVFKNFEGLYIAVQGVRYGSDNQNQCQIRIDNLTKENRNYILRATSPFTRDLSAPFPRVVVNAGRQSYGTVVVWSGVVLTSFVTQPPDISVVLNCLTAYEQNLEATTYNTGAQSSMKSIAEKAASELGLELNFIATDKQIYNFSLSGPKQDYVKKISQLGDINVTIDNSTLIVKDSGDCVVAPVKVISQKTGMVGIPEFIETGVLVKYLFDNDTAPFQNVQIESELNPGANGDYMIYKLAFDLSTRNTPFYWIAYCVPIFRRTIQ